MNTNSKRIGLAASLGVAALIMAPSTQAAFTIGAGGTGTGLSAADLVDILVPNASGINVVGGTETYSATPWHNAAGTLIGSSITDIENSAIGAFAGATPINGLPFSGGVLLTTGTLGGIGPAYEPEETGALPPNNSGRTGVQNGMPSSATLNTTMGYGDPLHARNAAWLSFRFTSESDAFSFQYVFGSDEYGSGNFGDLLEYNDAFAFVLTDMTDMSQINLAVLPGNLPVSVANVNGSVNSQYYTDNPVGSEADLTDSPYQIEYDGLAGGVGGLPLFAYAQIIAGREYRIDIVIADTGDRLGDSAVFLAADSFTSNPVPEPATYVGALALGALVASRLRRK
jgi:hypothetical protein